MTVINVIKYFFQFGLKAILSLVLVSIASLWAFVIVLESIFVGIRKGFDKLIYHKNRSESPPPLHYNSWDVETRLNPGRGGESKKWNHAYVTVEETGMRFHYVYTGKVPEHIKISPIDNETKSTMPKRTRRDISPKLLLCVHGFPENWFSWRYILREYDLTPDTDSNSYFVVAIDCRGYGDSDKPAGKNSYHLNLLITDIKGIVNQLGYDQCTLFGHDWGGVIGWTVAKIYPELLEKYVAMNCPCPEAGMSAALRSPTQLFLNSWYMYFFQLPILPELYLLLRDYHFVYSAINGKGTGVRSSEKRMTDEEIEIFKYSLRHSITAPVNYYRALLWPFCQPGPELVYPRKKCETKSKIYRVPTLLIWGDKDVFMNKSMATLTEEYIDSSNGSKVVFIEGASHWVEQDEPEKVMKIVREFLK